MKILKEGEVPTVGPDGYYNEYIPPELGYEDHWPIGLLRMDVRGFTNDETVER